MPFRATIPFLFAALFSACGFDRPVAPDAPIPVIKGILVAEADTQYFLLEWGYPADSSFDSDFHPIDPSLVALEVSSGASAAPLVPLDGLLSNFVITIPIHADSTYALTGTVDGTQVSGSTLVPHDLTVITPVPDTVVLDSAWSCAFRCAVPFQVSATGAAGFLVEMRDSTGRVLSKLHPEQGSDSLQVDPFVNARWLYVYALDQNSAAWVFAETPASSVEGAVGLFGSALLKKVAVRWQ